MTEEKNNLVYNDVEYAIEDLSDKAKYIVGQIQQINSELATERAKIDRLEVAKRGFTNMLGDELEQKEEGAE